MATKFTMVPNEVFDAFLALDLAKREQKVFLYVLRATKGWNAEVTPCRPAEVAKATGLGRQHVGETVTGLVAGGLLVQTDAGVAVQWDVLKWDMSQNRTESVPKQDKKRPKTGHQAPVKPSDTNDFEAPKDNKDKIHPYSPQGDDNEVPFSEPLPVQPDEADAPSEDNGFDAWFEACWAKVLRKVNRKPSLAAARRIPKKHRQTVLDALDVYNASRNWKKPGELEYYAHFSTFLNKERWREMQAPQAAAAAANPYAHKPWGPIWQQAGMPQSFGAWMNMASHLGLKGTDTQEIGMLVETRGIEVAGDWLWQKMQAV